MKLGSLFDGIGGFPYSASKYGFEPVWASEIEPFPIKVTQCHFPDMKHLGDITQINGAEIEPVDVITFGSPCQDLSVAGKREGLAGERSGLFMEAVRIIREMRRATGGKYPRFAVWENVPGAFSSHGGQDFRAVLEEIGNAEIPMPESGRWATAGMVRTETADIAWRTLDAQHHGVPQRRRRIFLVADFAGTSAGEILFVEQGLSGNTQESREARQEAARDVGTGIDMPIWDIGDRRRVLESINVAPSLLSKMGTGGNNVPIVPTHNAITMRMREGCAGGGKSPLISEDKSLTLGCNNDQTVFTSRINSTPEGIAGAVSSKWAKGTGGPAGDECYNLVAAPQLYDMTHADEVMRPVQEGLSPTLNSRMGTGGNQVPVLQPCAISLSSKQQNLVTSEDIANTLGANDYKEPQAIAYSIAGNTIDRQLHNGGNGKGVNKEVSFTLNTIDRHAVAYLEPANTLLVKANLSFRSDQDTLVAGLDCRNGKENGDLCGTLQAKANGGFSTHPVRIGYAVRRLTPTECLRLQGYPDWWLDIEGATDTAKYKAIGNSVAIPCVDFVMSGIARVLGRMAVT